MSSLWDVFEARSKSRNMSIGNSFVYESLYGIIAFLKQKMKLKGWKHETLQDDEIEQRKKKQ
ncbi:CLUMA_CG011624, isoform A [Clunio marinus]|uniref:CLUMA_CG011624, isoform A n=1 Tax=Clunio marinus TaxID=568069 RepID=A0A1J1IGU5_9DIPT|nr:CLUMA_CG011624, isoform A [Clunio marinus]